MALTRGEQVLNALAWGGVIALIFAAMVVANTLGFAGLVCLGLLAAFICTTAELEQDVPARSERIFEAYLRDEGSPEARAAKAHQRLLTVTPLRFGRRCGLALAAIGAAGFVWQQWLR